MDDQNKLQKVESDIVSDIGFSGYQADADISLLWFQNCYHSKNWVPKPQDVITDTPTNTYCRAPWSTQVNLNREARTELRITNCFILCPLLGRGWN